MRKTTIPLDHELLKTWARVHGEVQEKAEESRLAVKKMVDDSWDLLRTSLSELGLLPKNYDPYSWAIYYCEKHQEIRLEEINLADVAHSFSGYIPDEILKLMLEAERNEPGTINQVMSETVRFDDL